jgi:hypothetical protein
MILPKDIADDFKTDRKDILPPLPAVLRLVPILFYLTVISSVILCALFFYQLKLANDSIQTAKAGLAEAQAQVASTAAERKLLESQILRATDVQGWVEGSRPLQPLVVAVARSIKEEASLADLKLDRDEESPSSLKLAMRIGTSSPTQLEETTDAISKENFRLLQPEQTLAEGQINYRATIVPISVVSTEAAETP